ncbi:flagellar filament capping protein FliD [Billgrantia pellis]|uniref:Flagellar hook-associated protein 2 n=1 Tax=Billgrantia pellis TaxID=2606936 RepID=A0A7V7KJ62_9GAMM|nr:flagellar filament capping protein FliD [Halomonas pellis]KAA0014494.1 flagellar filament capping protein FliD [Halomonas pellis]
MATISSLGIGSGLDLNGLLDQLNAAERKKLEPIALQQKSVQAKISAYGKLQGALTKLQDAAAKLNKPEFYQSVSSNVTGSSVTAAAGAEAQPGRYDVNVTSLARAQSLATGGFAARDADLGAGEMTINVGSGDSAQALHLRFDAAASSLEDIRDAINAEKAGVTASIVNDGSAEPYRLVLSVDDTGTDAAVQSITFASDNGDAALDDSLSYGGTGTMSQTVAAKNAALEVNGITITSQSNQVEGAIQGLTLNLAEAGEATVRVERNTLAIREAVGGFVKAYNELRTTAQSLTRFNSETGDAGELLGDSALRTVESRLRSTLSGGVGEGEFRMLSDIGITLQRDGSLKLDEGKLSDIVANSPDQLSRFFAGETKASGMAGKLGQSLDQMLGDKGLLDNAKKGLESRIESLKDRYARMETGIERTIERYRIQFGKLDGLIAQMNQTSDYLFQQFEMMNAQLGRKK